MTDSPDRTPSTGFSRGYFGCFGVLAAVATVGVLVLVYLAVFARTHPVMAAEVAPVADSASPGAPGALIFDGVEACRVAAAQAGRDFRTKGRVTPIGDAPLSTGGSPPMITCHARDAKGALAIDTQVRCAGAVNDDCVIVLVVHRGGAELKPRGPA